MTTKIFISTAAVGLALTVPAATAQQQTPRDLTAVIKVTVTPWSGADALDLDGMVTLKATVNDENGSRRVSYQYELTGTAMGQSTQSRYELRGLGEGASPFEMAPPADTGMNVTFTASLPGAQHSFDLLLQATVDENLEVVSLVARGVVAKP
jgi:archaellin